MRPVIFIALFVIAAAGIGWGVYVLTYTHPPDYTEGTVTIQPAVTASDTPPVVTSSEIAAPLVPAKPIGTGSGVTIDGHVFSVDLADTVAKRAQGLSGRERLREDQGMLFLFPVSARQSFWMKDMKFSLDIVWISGSTIVDISENVPIPAPGQSLITLPQYSPSVPVDKVLEIDAGLSARFGFKIGDAAIFRLPKDEAPQ